MCVSIAIIRTGPIEKQLDQSFGTQTTFEQLLWRGLISVIWKLRIIVSTSKVSSED